MKRAEPPSLAPAWPIGGGFVVAFGFFNLVMPDILQETGPQSELFFIGLAFWGGALGAQAALHTSFCVFARCGLILRFCVAAAVAALWYGAGVLGDTLSHNRNVNLQDFDWSQLIIGLLCLPLIAIAAQAPLWAVRLWYGWRITHVSEDAHQTPRRRPSIRHVMLATAAVAAALACVRWAIPADVDPDEFLLVIVFVAFVAMLLSGITTLPALRAVFRAKRRSAALLAVLLLDTTIVLAYVVAISFMAGMSPPAGELFPVVVLVTSFFVLRCGGMLVFRRLGYRLDRGRQGGPSDFDGMPGAGAGEKQICI